MSNASDDLPEPLGPVITTSLSRGISIVRFLRLCSLAPAIFTNSLATKRGILNRLARLAKRGSVRRRLPFEQALDERLNLVHADSKDDDYADDDFLHVVGPILDA